MAFNFPEPPVEDGTEVTNNATGVTYKYDLANDCWVVVNTNLVADIDSQLSTLSGEVSRLDGEIETALTERDELIESAIANNESQDGRIDALEQSIGGGIQPSVTYMLETDKIGNPSSEVAAVELVDSDDNFSNVKFQGTGGVTVTSNTSSIIIDGSGITSAPTVDPNDYYTKLQVDALDGHLQDQIDELTVTKGAASVYTLNEIGIQVGIRPGDFFIDATVAKNVAFLALAPEDDNGNDRPIGDVGDIIELVGLNNRSYRYTITTASDGVAGVEFLVAADPDDLLIAGTTFTIYIYPQNKTTASLDYVDNAVALKADKTYVDQELDTKLDKSDATSEYLTKVDASNIYVTSSYANSNYLRDGFQSHETINFRTGGTDTSPFKITNSTGGATLLKVDASGGSSSPVKFITDNGCNHQFVGKVKFERVANETQGFTIEGRKSDGTVGDLLHVYHNGGSVADAVNYSGKISSDNNIVNKQYVDNAVAGTASLLAIEDAEPDIHYGTTAPAEVGDGDLWVDTENMRLLMRVSGAWVNPDRQETAVDLSPYQKIVSPPGRKFKKINATNPTESGTFTYYETGGQLKLGINRRDAEGTKWLDINFTDNLNAPVLFRIIQWSNNTSHKTIRYGAIDKIVASDGGNVTCDVKYHSTNGSLSTGSNYFIIIGGLL